VKDFCNIIWSNSKKRILFIGVAIALLFLGLALLWYCHEFLVKSVTLCWSVVSDSEAIEQFIKSLGVWGPLAYILFQAAQVVLAPLPGEVTGGFVSGVLFGPWLGFVYSIVGLIIGSAFAFLIGRWFGMKVINKFIPKRIIEKFSFFLKPQGIFVSTFLFAIPQFPKDYFCMVLGWSGLPFRIFLPLMVIGRSPCTLMATINGALFQQKHYYTFIIFVLFVLLGLLVSYIYRSRLYRWLEARSASDTSNT
jgi:uncharacterized membrane protein YdjX (TVP38/TMEM64 family)